MSERTCRRCPSPIGRRNKSGLCQKCGIRRTYEDPERKERARAILRRNGSTPKAKAARRAAAIRLQIWKIGQAACPAGCEARKRAARRQSDTKLAAIPRELRDEYRLLVRRSKLPAAEAREVILQHHEAAMERFRQHILSQVSGARR